jgi:hypothetical protein
MPSMFFSVFDSPFKQTFSLVEVVDILQYEEDISTNGNFWKVGSPPCAMLHGEFGFIVQGFVYDIIMIHA